MNYLPLVHNIALLVALSVIYALVSRHFRRRTGAFQALTGLLFGCTTLVGMLTPMHWSDGVIIDGRSILLGVTGLFGGPIAALVAAVMAGLYRIRLGGAGLAMGLAVIVASAALGSLGHGFRRSRPGLLRPLPLLGLGYLIHGVMLACMSLLPGGLTWQVFLHLGLPVLLLYPAAFMVAGLFFVEVEGRARVEAAVKESEERYRAMVESTTDLVFRLDRDCAFLFGNPAALALTGLSPEALLGRTPRQLGFLEKLARMLDDAVAQVFATGRPVAVEYEREGPRGPLFLELNLSPERDAAGQVRSVVGLGRDISERRLQALDIQRMSQLYAALSQVNQAIVWSRTREALLGKICEVLVEFGFFKMAWIGQLDPATGAVTRLGQYGDAGGYLESLTVSAEPGPAGDGPVGRALREDQPCVDNQFQDNPANGIWRAEAARCGFAAVAAFPIRVGGQVWGVLALYSGQTGFFGEREIALLVEAAMDVSFALDNMERDEQARAAECSHRELTEQLHQAQKLESLGTLAGGVAHDINNVLAAILGLASAHRQGLASEEPLARSMDTITKACLRGRDLVRNLLAFGRKSVAGMGSVDLNGLVAETCALLESTTLKRVRISTRLDPAVAPLEGDPAALSHALMNLCVNAIDAMAGSGFLEIMTARLEAGGATLTVRDTGAGMTAEVLKQAVQPFYTTKPQGKGTGLGLALVYGTMKAHGGTLEIHSQPGEGTEVVLSFPPARRPAAEPLPAVGAGPAPAQAPALAILLVDDDELVRLSLAPMLAMLGHRVETAEGGQEALDRLHAGLDPDLVILDMNMPGLNGAETLAELLRFRPQQQVLLATGYSDQDAASLAVGHPRVSHIHKPFTLEELRDKLPGLEAAVC
jgi:PAS domain S-box-containing protein